VTKDEFYIIMEQRKYLRLDYGEKVSGKAKRINDKLGSSSHATLDRLLDECHAADLIKKQTIIKVSVSTNPDLSLATDECMRGVRSDVFKTKSLGFDKRITMILVPEWMYDHCGDVCKKTNNAAIGKGSGGQTCGTHAHFYTRCCANQTEPHLAHMLCARTGQCCTILWLLCELTFISPFQTPSR